MRIAVIAVTKQGIKKGDEVEQALQKSGHDVTVYVPGKYSLLKLDNRMPFRKPLRDLFPELMKKYEGLVCIMALGIVVRLIAPSLSDKTSDPAVVVMDETGQNVVSVLSGHWGGANSLTKELAEALQAHPVITTATDVRGLPAIEMLAKDMGWVVGKFSTVRRINSAIVNGEEVRIYCDIPLERSFPDNLKVFPLNAYNPYANEGMACVVVTNRFLAGDSNNTLFLRPKNLVLGIGCRKGVSKTQIQDAVVEGLAKANVVFDSVREIVSVEIKADEPGLVDAAADWELPIRFFSIDQINGIMQNNQGELASSEFVKEKIGVDGVCEPAAILATESRGSLLLPKMPLNGVTVAITEDI